MCFSQVIKVKQDGTGDFTLIQQAVDSAQSGDTVLVYPGTYLENVEIENKGIVLGSLVMSTGDLYYMHNTIIDGNFDGGCINILDCIDGLLIHGFTLIHGIGSYNGAISGGGISIFESIVDIKQCNITNNKVTGCGGGVYIEDSNVCLSGTWITQNQSYISGGGIHILTSEVEFDPINRCNIYENYSAAGTDIFKLGDFDSLFFYVDTFTVMQPDYYYLYSDAGYGYPQHDIIPHIQNAGIQSVSQDIYVAPWGDNENSGLTPDEPLRNVYYALLKMESDSLSPDTIHMAPGVYSPSGGERFPLSLKRNGNIKGTHRDSCFLDGENEIFLLRGINLANDYEISNITLQNGNGNNSIPHLLGAMSLADNQGSSYRNMIIQNNRGKLGSCGSIYWPEQIAYDRVVFKGNIGGKCMRIGSEREDTATFTNCEFIINGPDYSIPEGGNGGGCYLIGGEYEKDDVIVNFINCLFDRNHVKEGGNSIAIVYGGKAFAINCTFGNNSADGSFGGNINVTHNSDLIIYNSVLYQNFPAELYMYTTLGQSTLSIYNSLVQGGEEGIRIYTPDNTVYYDPTNIDTDPMWDTAGMYPYSLMAGSPCIDAGTLNLPEGITLPETDLAGNPRVYNGYVDMGAYEYGPWVQAPEIPQKPKPALLSVYPNPFYYETHIKYTIPEQSRALLRVFDMTGKPVATLMDVETYPGSGTITWRGKDDFGNRLPILYVQ